jgi:organic radical activating enzyme
MAEEELTGTVPFLSSIGFSMTARCPIVCPHCIVDAGPHRKEEMRKEEACAWLQQAAAYRHGHIKSVVITGGEPFYTPDLLKELLGCAVSCRLVPIVITNAFWATSLSVALDTLQHLPQIRMLTVSTDTYHQRFIPIANAKNALLAARELGLAHNAALCFESEYDVGHQNTRAELATVIDESLIRSASVSPAGRALRKLKIERFETTTECPPWSCTAADYPTIFPDGKLICCMGMVQDLPPGHPLLLGNIREKPLAELLDAAERNTALQILRVWGPRRLLRVLEQGGARDRLPSRFIKHRCCDVCYALAADLSLLRRLLELTSDGSLAEEVAFARIHYLNELGKLEAVNSA